MVYFMVDPQSVPYNNSVNRAAKLPTEHSFDPASPEGWEQLSALGHRMLDDMIAYLRSLPDQPAWREMPTEVQEALREPVPQFGEGAELAYQQFKERILPYPNGNLHPRFFGWVQGNGTALGMLSDMLAAGLNAHLGGFNHAPALVERQVIDWFGELLGMPKAGGLLVTGGTMANTLGLAVARFSGARKHGLNVRDDGLQTWPGRAARKPMVFYGSDETHSWARKATEWLGLGNRAFRRVPVNADFQMDLQALSRMIIQDRADGLEPFCVIGTAGTVNTGATDDLPALASLARRENLWFHVDGAFGALAYLSPSLRNKVKGLELADSIAFDLHKWGSLPFECACVLVRDAEVHKEAFATGASYLATASRGVSAGVSWSSGVDVAPGEASYFSNRGLDLTRGFKALKVWMTLKADGVEKLATMVEQNVAQCAYLADLITSHAELELMAPVPLNIVCFRYCGRATAAVESAATDADVIVDSVQDADRHIRLDSLNAELLQRLQERGIAVPSSTLINGRFAIRVANVNHRSKTADFHTLVDGVVSIGRELVSENQAGG